MFLAAKSDGIDESKEEKPDFHAGPGRRDDLYVFSHPVESRQRLGAQTMDVSALPHVNAVLNGIAACFLMLGYVLIRRGEKDKHRKAMIAAASVSALFLVSYITLRFHAPVFEFRGEGVIRPIYYALLISHVILSVCIVPLVLLTLYRALRGTFDLHRRVARWAWPAWMYVSVTGIVVYLMLYQVYPPEVAGLQ